MHAVIVVDVQYDFCEGGSLAVVGGADVARSISTHLDDGHYDVAVATRDRHLDPGAHFSATPDFVHSWPPHCRIGTHGAELHAALDTTHLVAVFDKGAHVAAYSGFDASADDVLLGDWLRAHDVDSVEIVGIATDHCIRATALDAARNGFATTVRLDLTAGVARPTVIAALAEMTTAGVRLVGEPVVSPDRQPRPRRLLLGYRLPMTDPRAPDPGQAGGNRDGDVGPASGYVPPPPFAPRGYPTGPPGYPPVPGYGPPYPGPGYGYPVYAIPPGYVAVPAYYPTPGQPREPLAFGVIGAALAGLGALLLIVSLVGLPWYSGDSRELTTCGGGGGFTTGDVRCVLDNYGDAASGLSVAFFSWLAWLLLVLSAGSAVGAALPFRGLSLAFRIIAPIVAGFAVLLSFGAIELTSSIYATGDTYDRYFDRLSFGFWFAIAGYLLIGAGAIIGPRTAPPHTALM